MHIHKAGKGLTFVFLGASTALSACATPNYNLGARQLGNLNTGSVPQTDNMNWDGHDIARPACVAQDGTPVRYLIDESPFSYKIHDEDDIDMIEFAYDSGLPYDQGAYIHMNVFFMLMMSKESRVLVAAHECAHHALGHTNLAAHASPDIVRAEAEADCAAVQIMQNQYGYKREDVLKALEIFRNPFITASVSPDDREHGGLETRYKRSLTCLAPT